MSVIKAMGVSCTVASCIIFGFLKSSSLKARGKKLLLFCDGLDLLYEHIEQENYVLDAAIKKSFAKCGFLLFDDSTIICRDNDLTPEDRQSIDLFFASLGKSAKKAECDRIKHFKTVLSKRASEVVNEAPQKCKLWQTGGICTGLLIGILLI